MRIDSDRGGTRDHIVKDAVQRRPCYSYSLTRVTYFLMFGTGEIAKRSHNSVKQSHEIPVRPSRHLIRAHGLNS